MKRSDDRRYRVWIAQCNDWHPHGWHEVPPLARAVEPAQEESFSAADAAAYMEGFNTANLRQRGRKWAVVVPVDLRFEGDLRPGQSIVAGRVWSDSRPGRQMPA